jgi:hypothetical protein
MDKRVRFVLCDLNYAALSKIEGDSVTSNSQPLYQGSNPHHTAVAMTVA